VSNMSSNVDFNICPECLSLNSAIVWFVDENMYQIVCKECAHEFESGRLPWESIRLLDMDVYDERDEDVTNEFAQWLSSELKTDRNGHFEG